MSILNDYQRNSGQKLNPSKSKFYLASKVTTPRVRSVSRTLSFDRGSFPMKYLGAPIGPGQKKMILFQPLIENIALRIQGWHSKLLSAAGKLVLIKHVLCSMPIHILSCISVPKGVFKSIESLLARFFWGSSEFGARRHWIAWTKICRPIYEGGLGIRRLEDIKKAFILKQCWLLCESNSLWSSFMKAKYKVMGTPVQWKGPVRCSVEWKDILKMKIEFLQRCAWTVGTGEISFWCDCWNPKMGILDMQRDHNVRLKDFFVEDSWNFDSLINILGLETVRTLYQSVPRLSEHDDKRHWIPDQAGSFSVKSAWESIRNPSNQCDISKLIWGTPIPVTAKIICWRIIHNSLPVDQLVMQRGVSMASKCCCCHNPNSESLNHLFVESDLAQHLWKFFSPIFAVPYYSHQSILSRIRWWFLKCKGKSHFSLVGRLACIAICRQIWSFRNNSIYGGMVKDFMHARLVVIDTLQHVEGMLKPTMRTCSFGIDSLQMIGITPRNPPAPKNLFCSWNPPTENNFALNVDGSCRQNDLAIGGIIRNCKGDFVAAFAGPAGQGSSLKGEIFALHTGAELVESLGLQAAAFSDSKSLVQLIGKKSPLWNLHSTWREMHYYLRVAALKVYHCFRESNQVADFLSKFGHNLEKIHYFYEYVDLPLQARKLLWLDKMGATYIRK